MSTYNVMVNGKKYGVAVGCNPKERTWRASASVDGLGVVEIVSFSEQDAIDKWKLEVADKLPGSILYFSDVREILDQLIANWKVKNQREPQLSVHGSKFKWSTQEDLLGAMAFQYQLIDSTLIGSDQGKDTILVKALTTGVDTFPQMPYGGPYATNEQIEKLVQWIDAGCPSAAPAEHMLTRSEREWELNRLKRNDLTWQYRQATGTTMHSTPLPPDLTEDEMIKAILDSEFRPATESDQSEANAI
jgi:hypothetical protein